MPKERIDGLTDLQENAIAVLLTSSTRKEAAERLGVTRAVLYRWLQEPAFLARYNAAQRDVYDHAMILIMDEMKKSVETLGSIRDNTEAHDSSRVAAAKYLIDKATEHIHNGQLEERLAELEEAFAALKAAAEG